MKKNKTITSSCDPDKSQECNAVSNESKFLHGLWMEFEDSYIRILSGIEPGVACCNSMESQQQIAF